MRIHIGPVGADAAIAWTTHMLGNLEVIRRRTNELPFRLPPEIADAFHDLLVEWQAVAKQADPFSWDADLEPASVRVLVQYWANLDSMSPELLERLGIEWSPPNARPFFGALATGVAGAFDREGLPDEFARLLAARAQAGEV